MKCIKCGETIPDGSLFCNKCGEAQKQKCANCGHVLEIGSAFCNKCGTKVETAKPKEKAKRPPVKKVAEIKTETAIKPTEEVSLKVEEVAVSTTANDNVTVDVTTVTAKEAKPKPNYVTVEKYLTPSLVLGGLFVLMICSLFAGAVSSVMGFPVTQVDLFYILGNFELISMNSVPAALSYFSSLAALVACVITAITTFCVALVKLIKAFKNKETVNLLSLLITSLTIFVFASMVCYLGNSYPEMPNALNGASIAGLVIFAMIISAYVVLRAIANKKVKTEKTAINKKSVIFNVVSLTILFVLQILLVCPIIPAGAGPMTAFGIILNTDGGIMTVQGYLYVCLVILFVTLAIKRKVEIILSGGSDTRGSFFPCIIIFVLFLVSLAAITPVYGIDDLIWLFAIIALAITSAYFSKAGRFSAINGGTQTGNFIDDDGSEPAKTNKVKTVEKYLTNGICLLISVLLIAYMIYDCFSVFVKGYQVESSVISILHCVSLSFETISALVGLILVLVYSNRLAKGVEVNLIKLTVALFVIFVITDVVTITIVIEEILAFQPFFPKWGFTTFKTVCVVITVLGFIAIGAVKQISKGNVSKQKPNVVRFVFTVIGFAAAFISVGFIMSPAVEDLWGRIHVSMSSVVNNFLYTVFKTQDNWQAYSLGLILELAVLILNVFVAKWFLKNLFDSDKINLKLPVIGLIVNVLYAVLSIVMVSALDYIVATFVNQCITLTVSILCFVCACIVNKNRKKLLKGCENSLE